MKQSLALCISSDILEVTFDRNGYLMGQKINVFLCDGQFCCQPLPTVLMVIMVDNPSHKDHQKFRVVRSFLK